MARQDVLGAHGYDIYPQKLVHLIGCHVSRPEVVRSPKTKR